MRTPMGQLPDIDPQVMKEYRVDTCYFGTLSLRQAKIAYLASLAGQEPNDKKVPNFGVPQPPSSALGGPDAGAPKPPAPIASASVSVPVLPPASVAPAVLASAPVGARDGGVPFPFRPDLPIRAPYERTARACPIAAAMASPPMPDVDKVLVDFAPFA